MPKTVQSKFRTGFFFLMLRLPPVIISMYLILSLSLSPLMIHYYFGTFDDCFLVLKMLSTLHSPFVCFLPPILSSPPSQIQCNECFVSFLFSHSIRRVQPIASSSSSYRHHFMNPMLCRPPFFLSASFVLVFYVCCLVCILSSSFSLSLSPYYLDCVLHFPSLLLTR